MPPVRTDLTKTSRQAQMTLSRATLRKVNTNNLAPEASHLDGYQSQTDTDVEIAQSWGVIGVPLEQEESNQQQEQASQEGAADEGLIKDQPKGKSAEVIVNRIGSQSHP